MTEGSGLTASLLGSADAILGVRDSIGAVLKPVYLVTRTWTGDVPGDGDATDTEVQMLPSPGIRTFEHDLRIQEGGVVKQGDIMLKNVSKQSYPDEDSVKLRSESRNVEKFYRVGDALYSVVSVNESHITWDVLLRRMSDQTRYVD